MDKKDFTIHKRGSLGYVIPLSEEAKTWVHKNMICREDGTVILRDLELVSEVAATLQSNGFSVEF